ncbi:hypothetical protein L596_013887 [Steinernema carpocapsae]|uniref:TIL domain-containing protein n=1 Tax=Steinernema carpocapsae TaxID=34508 RepID=A0A4V6A582_STECR|nr:hypothetical protein L596_013887 [Steinernema carpocapsae]
MKSVFVVLLVFALVALGFSAPTAEHKKCNKNEKWVEEGPCDWVCRGKTMRRKYECPQNDNIPKCKCVDGYVRDPEGVCNAKEECEGVIITYKAALLGEFQRHLEENDRKALFMKINNLFSLLCDHV